jgi:hypothetical protein
LEIEREKVILEFSKQNDKRKEQIKEERLKL